jgi:hypothetical protein
MVYMPSDIASDRWCPQVMGRKCLGDECMAWRWRQVLGETEAQYGYCGFVGAPKESWVIEHQPYICDESAVNDDNVITLVPR